MSSGGFGVLPHDKSKQLGLEKQEYSLLSGLHERVLHAAKICLKCTRISKCLNTLICCNVVNPVDDLGGEEKKSSQCKQHNI